MKISIKTFNVNMEIKKTGIEFEVRNPKKVFQGDLILTNTKLIWCKGKVSKENGKSVSWNEFIGWMNDR